MNANHYGIPTKPVFASFFGVYAKCSCTPVETRVARAKFNGINGDEETFRLNAREEIIYADA